VQARAQFWPAWQSIIKRSSEQGVPAPTEEATYEIRCCTRVMHKPERYRLPGEDLFGVNYGQCRTPLLYDPVSLQRPRSSSTAQP
jgi:hypothetical protein